MTDEAAAIARGAQPSWEQNFEHSQHGTLTFKVKALPTNKQWLLAAAMQEEIAPGVTMQCPGALAAEAAAGILTLMERPVLSENRIEDPDTQHVRLARP